MDWRDPSLLYHPITATPFRHSEFYTEMPPCPALQPYIRCFWGTPTPVHTPAVDIPKPDLVIPDTCTDIIFTLDYTHSTIESIYCAMGEDAIHTGGSAESVVTSTFAIRFYAWTAALFAERPLSGSKNQIYAAEDFFPSLTRALTPMLMSVSSLSERANIAGTYLLQRFQPGRASSLLMNAVCDIIASRGARRIADLSASAAVSPKRLERVFDEQIGLSPKSFSSLVRYQMLWQELSLGRGGSMLDLVEKYGYYDQAHLLNDFKKRHTMTPAQALQLARS